MSSLEIWSLGYCRARGYGDPVPGPAGLWFDIGFPDQLGRHVLTSAFAPEAYRRLVAGIARPFTYVEALAPRETVLPHVPASWIVRDPAWLMATRLTAPPSAEPPPGYTLRLTQTDRKLHIDIEAPDGSPAATGRCGLAGDSVTFDRIITEEAHRRRGLGGLIMNRLTTAALEYGASQGVLIATPDGRALYSTLGWSEVGEVVSVISG
jgi:GNAT superfamily N-acetyltransferase